MIPMGSESCEWPFVGQNKNFGGVSFGIDGDGNYGYYGADGSLVPFKSGNPYLRYNEESKYIQCLDTNGIWKNIIKVNAVPMDMIAASSINLLSQPYWVCKVAGTSTRSAKNSAGSYCSCSVIAGNHLDKFTIKASRDIAIYVDKINKYVNLKAGGSYSTPEYDVGAIINIYILGSSYSDGWVKMFQ